MYRLSAGWSSTPASNAYGYFDFLLVTYFSVPQFPISQTEIKLVPAS